MTPAATEKTVRVVKIRCIRTWLVVRFDGNGHSVYAGFSYRIHHRNDSAMGNLFIGIDHDRRLSSFMYQILQTRFKIQDPDGFFVKE